MESSVTNWTFYQIALYAGAACLGGSILLVVWYCVLCMLGRSAADDKELVRMVHWGRVSSLIFLVLAWVMTSGSTAGRQVASWMFWMGAGCCAFFVVNLILLGLARRALNNTDAGSRMNRWFPVHGAILMILGYLLGL